MQFKACFSGAVAGSGKASLFRSNESLVVRLEMSVSKFLREVSRALRTSTGEKRLKTSSLEFGNSQNYLQ